MQRLESRREYGLDWLRVIAFVILIAFHTGMYFAPGRWSVKNPEISEWLVWPMDFLHAWRLPLLFFISGAGVNFSLRRRTAGQFVGERLRRLGIPLLVGFFIVCPPQIYVERVLAGCHYASYWDFWRTVFQMVPYPKGNLTWTHLWFLPYILTYSLLGLPLFAWVRSDAGSSLCDRLARFCDRPGAIYLIPIPTVVAACALGPYWPENHNLTSDWANFTVWLLTFMWGFVICGNPRFLDLIQRRRVEFLSVAIGMTALYYAIRVPHLLDWTTGHQLFRIKATIDCYVATAMIFALVGWSRALLNHESPALRYATTAVYPFYIVHQTITILLGYAWLGWHAPFAVKFPALFTGTFLGSWLIYEAVRRYNISRLLFGLNPLVPVCHDGVSASNRAAYPKSGALA
jgi:glucan biosynthesis protein C